TTVRLGFAGERILQMLFGLRAFQLHGGSPWEKFRWRHAENGTGMPATGRAKRLDSHSLRVPTKK
ncbi:MAG TPA: hypothetical protein VFF82_01940, partial [Rhodocyclaceae bacterium]|nr:hypothetical protein [Rhodocyclaceae bacterium]